MNAKSINPAELQPIAAVSTETSPTTPALHLSRSGDVHARRNPVAGRVHGCHGTEMQVAELGPEMWSALLKGQNSPQLNDQEREALQELAEWKLASTALAKTPTASDEIAPIRSLTINVAQICNLACTYCAAGGDGTYGSKTKVPDLDLTRAQLSKLLALVPSGESFMITFLGGEPLVHPAIIRAIVRDARLLVAGRDVKLRFDIVTNGTLITSEIAEMLASMKANVTVSIDGAPEDNDRARVTKGGRGSSHMVLKGVAELVKVKDRLGKLIAGSVFGKHNLNVVEAWEFLSKLPFDSLKFEFAAEAGDEFASRRFAQGVTDVAERAYARGGEKELRRLHTFDHLFQVLDSQARVENHCEAGKGHLQLDTDGKFTVCQWFVGQADEIVGSGLDLDLTVKNKRLKAFSEPLISKEGCNTCWARHICGGGCMHVNKVKTGQKNKIDTAYCERTRTIIAKGIERYAEARYKNDDQSVAQTGNNDGAVYEVH